jgi:predicted flap endonuclease-1-like 5' DNA nuclease
MFEQWYNFWRDWMFWWLPGGDAPEGKQPDKQPEKPAQAETKPKAAAKTGGGQTADAPAPAAGKSSAGAASGSSTAPAGGSDDLTAIKGIGPAIQRKLAAVGVESFADLAAADASDLAQKIGSRPVTAERVRAWIAEARKRS